MDSQDSPTLPPINGDPELLQQRAQMDHVRVDVLVVGAGLPGLRAALAAREVGLDVLVFEASAIVGSSIHSVPTSNSHPPEWPVFDRECLADGRPPAIYRLYETFGTDPKPATSSQSTSAATAQSLLVRRTNP